MASEGRKGRLWDYFDGEPFLVNPHLAVLTNPRKKGKKSMAARRRRRTRARVSGVVRRAPARRRRARRNPYPVAGMVVNPRRKRRHTRRKSVMRHNPRRRSARRNPAFLGIALPPLQGVLFAGVGFIAPPMVEGFISQFLPVSMQTNTIGKYAIRIAAVLGLSVAVKKLIGASEGNMVAIGGGAYVLTTAVSEFAPGVIPGLGAYSASNGGLGQYVTSGQPTFSSLGAAPFGASFPGLQTRNDVPVRFNRF